MFPVLLKLQLDIPNGDRAAVVGQDDRNLIGARVQEMAGDGELRAHPAGVLEAHARLERTRYSAKTGIGEIGPLDVWHAGLAVVRSDERWSGEIGIEHFECDHGSKWLASELEFPRAGRVSFSRKRDDARVQRRLHPAKELGILGGGLRLGGVAKWVGYFNGLPEVDRVAGADVLQRTREHTADVAAIARHLDVHVVRAVKGNDDAVAVRQADAGPERRTAKLLPAALGPRGDDGLQIGKVVEENAKQ